MNVIIFDTKHVKGLHPLTFTRPMGALRCGILTTAEKWEHYLKARVSYACTAPINEKYPANLQKDNLFIAGDVVPTKELAKELCALNAGESLMKEDRLIAIRFNEEIVDLLMQNETPKGAVIQTQSELSFIEKTFHLLIHNKAEIKKDFELITANRASQSISETVTVVGAHKNPSIVNNIFIEEGAEVEYCYLNPQEGPIYIGKNAKVMEVSMLRGPVCIGESSQVSMGAKIYGGTAAGPWSKLGGEVSNSIIIGYSNKVHDGYLGDSVIGEWCNLGADTNTSNLKNDYSPVKLWDYATERFQLTGLQFCGLIMGDYSRCAINTSFNSGTVVGIGSNIFGSGFPRNFVPSYIIGGPQGMKVNGLTAAQKIAGIAMERRNIEFTEADAKIMEHVFESTKVYRNSLK